MLVRFRAENFRSLKDEQELSLVASSLKEDRSVVVTAPHVPNGLLPVAAVYGANASGKSNVLDAMRFACDVVKNSQTKWQSREAIPRRPFLLQKTMWEKPSVFVFDAVVEGVLFEFGFSLNSKEVVTEWLHAFPKGRPRVLFSRDTQAPDRYSFGKHLTGENRRIEKLTRPNSLFLSAAAQNNHPLLTPLFSWFSGCISFYDLNNHPMSKTKTIELIKNKKWKKTILDFLKYADIGIVDVDVILRNMSEVEKVIIGGITDGISGKFEDDYGAEFAASGIQEIQLFHEVSGYPGIPIQFSDESQGTSNFLALLGPVLSALEAGHALVVDELESSIHPELARRIVGLFNSKKTNPKGAQLVFSTHNTNLLGGDLIRRDQIWFTEKDGQGATHLYPLTDFHPRGTENVERGYLQGRYGAIPFLGDFDRLIEEGNGDGPETAPE